MNVERLTYSILRDSENQAHESEYSRETLLHRLAAYEDSGLTPEQVAELAEKARDGRLVVLPIKPGKEFFYIDKGRICTATLATYEVGHLAVFFWGIGNMKIFTALIFESGHSDIGKTVFLTRAEAEAALRGGLKEGNHAD